MLRRKILLVDDDDDDQLLFKEAISEIATDVDCVSADNGLDALAHLRTVNPAPSLIFMDLNMPLMNGFECLEEIKKEERFKNIPVVIFSTSNNPQDWEQSRLLGAKMFLTKVPDFTLFKNKLFNILSGDYSA